MHVTLVIVLLITWNLVISLAHVTGNKVEKKTLSFGGGMELAGITRTTLLKVLSAFEDDINLRLKYKPVKPLFQAKFLNFRHAKPHIYPFMCDQGCVNAG